MFQTAFHFPGLQTLGDFATLGTTLEDKIPERRLFVVRLLDILGHPISHLAIGEMRVFPR